MRHTIWGVYRDGRLEIASTQEGEERPEGAEKICTAWKGELRKLIPFFERQAKKGLTPRKIRELYYMDDNPKPLAERRKTTIDFRETANFRVDWKKLDQECYGVWIVPHVNADNPARVLVWRGTSADKTFDIVKLCQVKISEGLTPEQIKAFLVVECEALPKEAKEARP